MERIELSKEFQEDAKVCLDSGRFRSCVSRSYYAVYHACIALFEHFNYRPNNFIGRSGYPADKWEHGVIIKHFHIEFVSKKRLMSWRIGVQVRTAL